jgi:hypothetical protein
VADVGVDPARGHLIRFLDDLRAAETAGAAVFEVWIKSCARDGLRGGLRTIAEREAGNATLLAARVAELGGACEASVSEALRSAALGRIGSRDVPDDEKLGIVLAHYADDWSVTRPITRAIEQLDADLETRELLRLIAEGEHATVAWLRAYQASL